MFEARESVGGEMKQIIFGRELEFDEKEHVYVWDGQPVPGVTSILNCLGKPALVPWAAGMAADHFLQCVKAGRTDYTAIHKESKGAHRAKSQAAADIGKNVHAYAEATFKNEALPEILTEEAQRGIDAFKKWLGAHKVDVLASERRVFSKKHYYAGTCDLVAKIDGKMIVGDIKTSSGIYPEMRLQTAAYQEALQEEKNMVFDGRLIIRFDKRTGEFEAKEFNEFELDFQGFHAALTLHRTLQAMAG